MADYWKSNPRKFCDFCQCWFADNKSSKEFHERGKRHKENVEKKIAELRKKGQKQYETQQQLSGFMKQIEEDAMKAFKKDVASNPDLIPEYKVALVENSVRQQQEQEELTAQQGSRYQPGGTSSTQENTPSSSTTPNDQSQEWMEAVSPEGHTYYWNTKTGVTQWEKPANFISAPSTSSQDKPSSKQKVDEESESDEDEEKKKKEGNEESLTRGTKRNSDAYGGWTSVSTEPEEEQDLQLPEANPLYMSSYVPQAAQYEPREKLDIKEKVVGSIKASSREGQGVCRLRRGKEAKDKSGRGIRPHDVDLHFWTPGCKGSRGVV
nr:LOW QUALITY PROTEIN: WW domain-binding protein 4-like [Lytechinus pictus]